MKKIWFLFMFMLMIGSINAAYVEDNRTIANLDHAIRIKQLQVIPSEIGPGSSGIIQITLKNSANLYLDDVRIRLDLPNEFRFLNDVDKVKISRLGSEAEKEFYFNIIATPAASEGIYKANLIVDYVSFLGANSVNVGEENQDNFTLGITLKGNPSIFAEIEDTNIYQRNSLGEVTIKFVNNGDGDAKFLTAKLLDSDDYDIISTNREYVGDLDSDDFESVDFRIKLKNTRNPVLLLNAQYEDILNGNFSRDFNLLLEIRTAEELGIKTNGTAYTVLIVILIIIAGYFIYKRYKKKKKKIITI